jgi:hypothetical protein
LNGIREAFFLQISIGERRTLSTSLPVKPVYICKVVGGWVSVYSCHFSTFLYTHFSLDISLKRKKFLFSEHGVEWSVGIGGDDERVKWDDGSVGDF